MKSVRAKVWDDVRRGVRTPHLDDLRAIVYLRHKKRVWNLYEIALIIGRDIVK